MAILENHDDFIMHARCNVLRIYNIEYASHSKVSFVSFLHTDGRGGYFAFLYGKFTTLKR